MQEKDIRKKLNQELDEMAPDILDKILSKPIEPVKSEKELFGKNKPLFKEKKSIKKYLWSPAMAAVAACIIIAIIIVQQQYFIPQNNPSNMAFNVIIDVNPSINIKVNKDGTVRKVVAENKDAKEIVNKVNKVINKDTDYNETVKLVIKQLDRKGYLKKQKNAMLLSVVSEDKEAVENKVKEIKKTAKQYKEENNIKATAVYQNCEVTDKVAKIAKKNNVSVGKAAFCMKIAEKEKVDVNKLCNKNIETIIKQAEENGTDIFELDIEDEIVVETESESITGETESVIETESESESISGETVTDVDETASEENTETISAVETTSIQIIN